MAHHPDAEICQTATNFMLRNSDLHSRVCAVCAEVCDRCAEDCERLAAGGEMVQQCAQTCRSCAEACREMSRQTGCPRHASIVQMVSAMTSMPTVKQM
jgi:hypothetical protein